MSDLQRTGQRLEVSMVKTVHLRDYGNEEYNGLEELGVVFVM